METYWADLKPGINAEQLVFVALKVTQGKTMASYQ